MKKFQVITDSTSDIEKKFRDEYGIDYFKMVFTIDNKDHDADLDWTELSPKDYYSLMKEGKRSVTSLPSRVEFETKFRKYLSEGYDCLYVACSTKLSGSRNYAETIINEILPEYQDRKAVCYDSLRSNYAEGLMAIYAAKLANEGKTIEEAIELLDKERLKFQVYAIVGSLEWLKKAGRVKASTAFFGNMMQIKPIICSDAKGNNYAFEKVVGRQKSIDRIINILCDRCIDPENSMVCIEHADCLEVANFIKEKVEERIHPKAINISSVGPIIGATTGPDTITISFYGEEVTIYDPE